MSALVVVFDVFSWLLSCWQVYLPLYVLFLFYLFKNNGTNPQRAAAFVEDLHFGGHRGSPEMEAENTLASLEYARREGVRAVEFDVSLTKDGIPVLLHDDTLDRTTNRRGKIREFTLKELHMCNCGAKFHRQKNNLVDNNYVPMFQHLSTLEEIVLWAIRHKMRMFLDIKDTDSMMTDALDAIFRRYKIYDLAIVCSLFPKATYRLKRQNPQILVCMSWCRWVYSYHDLDGVMPFFDSVVWQWLAVCYDTLYVWSASTWLASFLAADFVLVERSHVCESYVRYHQSCGRQVCVWTVNNENEMRWIYHVIRIPFLTDRPYLASKVIRK